METPQDTSKQKRPQKQNKSGDIESPLLNGDHKGGMIHAK